MKTLKEIIDKSVEFLHAKGIANPRRQAEELIADVLAMKRIDLYLEFDRPLNEHEVEACRQAVKRRGSGEPAQYIRGKVEFLDCEILVNPAVLIPRQETEILASAIVEELRGTDTCGKVLWDLCTGSGCLGIAIKKKFPDLEVALSDLSEGALSVARQNAEQNGAEVAFAHGDLLAPFAGKKADFVICNPPYVTPEEYISLDREVRDFEPKTALVAEENGLLFYRRLSGELPACLNPGAKVWLEIGAGQGEAVLALFQSPCWKRAGFKCDWSGNHRFFFLEIE